MKTSILGLGNPILSDDGVGNRVAQELEGNLAYRQDAIAIETSLAGLSLNDTRNASSPHDVDFATALELSKRKIADTSNFSQKITPEVGKSLPKCGRMIVKELNGSSQARSAKALKHFSDS